jgi:hypothetical protein
VQPAGSEHVPIAYPHPVMGSRWGAVGSSAPTPHDSATCRRSAASARTPPPRGDSRDPAKPETRWHAACSNPRQPQLSRHSASKECPVCFEPRQSRPRARSCASPLHPRRRSSPVACTGRRATAWRPRPGCSRSRQLINPARQPSPVRRARRTSSPLRMALRSLRNATPTHSF